MQINRANLRNLYTSYKALFFKGYQAAPDPVVNEIVMRTTTTAAEVVHHWLGAFPGMKEFMGEITIENVKAHNYTIANKEWFDAIAIKQADVERDEAGGVGLYGPRFSVMGDVAKQHEGSMCASLLCNGFTLKCYTGKNFFDEDHDPLGDGKFKFTNAGTKKISQANYRDAITNLQTRKNAAGRVLNLGRDMVLLTSVKNRATGLEILKAERSANGATNVDMGSARLSLWPEIDAINPDFWCVYDAAFPMKPIILQDEKALELLAQDKPDDDCVFNNHEFRYQAYKRQGFGFGLPEVAWASTGEDAA